MKRILFTLLLLAACLSASAYDFMVGGIAYNKNSDGVSVSVTYTSSAGSTNNYKNLSGKPSIPANVTYDGKKYVVTAIGHHAFDQHKIYGHVTIPNSVTSIGDYAFRDCELSSIYIGNSVSSIGAGAFVGCRLDSIIWNGNNIDVSDNAMLTTTTHTIITGPDFIGKGTIWPFSKWTKSVTYNTPNAAEFSASCFKGLNTIIVTDQVKSIPANFASGVTTLTSLDLGNSVTEIGTNAFAGCTGLKTVTIPSSTKNINSKAFTRCSSLTSVTIPSSVTNIGDSAFAACSSLASITIPNSVTKINESAFRTCSKLSRVNLGNAITEIGPFAFYYCSGLTSVTIPNSTKKIGESAFWSCM